MAQSRRRSLGVLTVNYTVPPLACTTLTSCVRHSSFTYTGLTLSRNMYIKPSRGLFTCWFIWTFGAYCLRDNLLIVSSKCKHYIPSHVFLCEREPRSPGITRRRIFMDLTLKAHQHSLATSIIYLYRQCTGLSRIDIYNFVFIIIIYNVNLTI